MPTDPLTEHLAEAKARRSARESKSTFVRGPIPLGWIGRACHLSGSAAKIGLAIWWQSGVKRRRDDLPITHQVGMRFGIETRQTRQRGLAQLEQAGLIRVDRQPNRAPRVEILCDE